MRLSLQFGYGMMEHSKVLIDHWGFGDVILSPRDLEENRIIRFAKEVSKRKGRSIIDPQCFLRDADHHRLIRHKFWNIFSSNSTNSLINGKGGVELVEELFRLSVEIDSPFLILPSILAADIDSDWFDFQNSFISNAKKIVVDRPVFTTIALSDNVIQDEKKIELIIEKAEKWEVNGFYIVPETPTAYLVDNPIWLANLLTLCAGLKLLRKEVHVGYCSHQMLCLAAARVDSIASGTWLNVRSFPPKKFYTTVEEDISRRAVWYYCSKALSEYKIPFLDIAQRLGILKEMSPESALDDSFAKSLFSGVIPSSVMWRETDAFRHYLSTLQSQVQKSLYSTFEQTRDHHLSLLDEAEKALKQFREKGVFGQDREFSGIIDVNRSALVILESSRGPLLSRNWGTL